MLVAVVAGGLVAGADARAGPETIGPISVEGVTARPTIGKTRTTAIYMTIENTGREGDRLVGAGTPVAERAELHAHVVEGGILRMRRLEAVAIEPGVAARFAPGERHVMLIGLARPLSDGDRFPLVLEFERAGRIEVEAVVRSPSLQRRRGMPGAGRRY